MGKWHGWTLMKNGRPISATMYIGELPERARVALYAQEGSRCTPLAYFNSKDTAERVLDWIDMLIDKLNEVKRD